MGLEGTRLWTSASDIETLSSDFSAEIPATLTDGRTESTGLTPADSFLTCESSSRPDTSARPAVGHPLFCAEPSEGISSETVLSIEDFDAFFERRLTEIEGLIADGRLTEASQLIRDTNATWRAFNAAHSEIPQSQRSAYLGRLYLARSHIEATYGESRTLWRTYYEARGYDLTGDHVRARLRYRAVMAMPVPSPVTAEIRDIGRTTTERRRALELEALDRLTATAASILDQRDQRLIFDRIYGFAENDINHQFLGSLRALIVSGRADTVDQAIEVLREDHLRARREFVADPCITEDWRVRVWPELTNARLEGGTLEMFGSVSPRTMTVTVGTEGGTIVVPGATYYFPASDHEVTVRMAGARVMDVRRGSERLTDRHGYYQDPSLSDVRIPSEVLALGGDRRREYAPSSETARIHPNTFDSIFDADGGYQTGGLFHFDESLLPMLEMETEEGLESLADDSSRGEYLIGVAERMRSRDGSYGVSAACLEEVFAAQFERAVSYVVERRSDEVDELRSDSENEDEFTAGLMTLVSEQMEMWSESGELAVADPDAARAWSIYNDMLDPADEYFNMMDESQDAMVDEAIITGITFLPTMGLGSVAAESVEGARAVRLVAAAASVGSRRLLLRFGPRLASLGARAAYAGVVGTTATTARVAVEAPLMTMGSSALTGHPMDAETAVDGSLHTAAHLGVYHAVGAALPRPLRFVAESYLGRDLGEWASGSAARRMGLRLYFNGGSLTTMTGVATGLSYTDASDDRNFADRVTGEAARMGYMSFLGGLGGEGAPVEAGRPTLLSDLREMGRDMFRDGIPIPAPITAGGIGFIYLGRRSAEGGTRRTGSTPEIGIRSLSSPEALANIGTNSGRFDQLAGLFETLPEYAALSRASSDRAETARIRDEVSAELGGRFENMTAVSDALQRVLRRHGIDLVASRSGLDPRIASGEITARDAAGLSRLSSHLLYQFYPDGVPLFRSVHAEYAGRPGTMRESGSDWRVGEAAGADGALAYHEEGMVLITTTMGDIRSAGGRFVIDPHAAVMDALTVVHPDGRSMPYEVVGGEGSESVVIRPIIAVGEPEGVEAPEAETARDTIEILPEDRPTMPPPADMPLSTPRPAVLADGPVSRSLPRAATAVGLAMRHANAHLADVTGFRFAIESSLTSPGEEGGAPAEVDIWVAGPEAETAFLETLRTSSARVTVENLGGGEYLVRDADRGDSVVTIRHGFELSVAQQTHLGEWIRDLPPSERDGLALTRYPRPRLESLVDHLIGRGWNQAQIEGLFADRGMSSSATAEIVGPRIRLAAGEGRSGGGAL